MQRAKIKVGTLVAYKSSARTRPAAMQPVIVVDTGYWYGSYSSRLRGFENHPTSRPNMNIAVAINRQSFEYFRTEQEAKERAATLVGAEVKQSSFQNRDWQVSFSEWRPEIVNIGRIAGLYEDFAEDRAKAEQEREEQHQWSLAEAAKRRQQDDQRRVERERFQAVVQKARDDETERWAAIGVTVDVGVSYGGGEGRVSTITLSIDEANRHFETLRRDYAGEIRWVVKR